MRSSFLLLTGLSINLCGSLHSSMRHLHLHRRCPHLCAAATRHALKSDKIICHIYVCCNAPQSNSLSPRPPQQGNAGMRPPQDVIDQIVDACSSWGFFQLVNHGVSQQLLDVHYAAMKQ